MSFRVQLHKDVEAFLDKLDRSLADRIRKRLELLKEDPFRYVEHYERKDIKLFKFRIGDYRALVDVDTRSGVVLVRHFDHRRRIYKWKF